MMENITQEIRVREGLDIVIWKTTTNGQFTIATAWKLIRVKGELVQGSNWFWHPMLLEKFQSVCGRPSMAGSWWIKKFRIVV